MRTRIQKVRLTLPALLAVGATTLAIAGCGGGGSGGGGGYGAAGSGASRPSATTTHRSSTSAPPPTSAGIPQHNGGDMDADNNGAPSDGDGDR
jgi:hypothetical protein